MRAGDTLKVCNRCKKEKPHGPNSARTSGYQSECRECISYRATWYQMVQRCTNPKHPKWPDYGKRGITVCEPWLVFDNFFADMGPRPPGMEIERIDNDKGYYKANCRWATRPEQQSNKRSNVYVTVGGEEVILAEIARRYGLPKNVVQHRYSKGARTVQDLTVPLRPKGVKATDETKATVLTMHAAGKTHKEISEAVGYPRPTISKWLLRWTGDPDRAIVRRQPKLPSAP